MILEVGYLILLSSKLTWKKLSFNEISHAGNNETYVYTPSISKLANVYELIFPSLNESGYSLPAAYMLKEDSATHYASCSIYTSNGWWLTIGRKWDDVNNRLGICCMRNNWGSNLPCKLNHVYYR